MKALTKEQLNLVCHFAEWLEKFAKAEVYTLPKHYRFFWSVPRKTPNGEWYSNWTTEALWDQFIKEREVQFEE